MKFFLVLRSLHNGQFPYIGATLSVVFATRHIIVIAYFWVITKVQGDSKYIISISTSQQK